MIPTLRLDPLDIVVQTFALPPMNLLPKIIEEHCIFQGLILLQEVPLGSVTPHILSRTGVMYCSARWGVMVDMVLWPTFSTAVGRVLWPAPPILTFVPRGRTWCLLGSLLVFVVIGSFISVETGSVAFVEVGLLVSHKIDSFLFASAVLGWY